MIKKRDLYWIKRIIAFLIITLIFGAISLFNLIQFNTSYMQEEREELQVFKRQIEWAVTPLIKNNNIKELQKYCDDFKDEDVEFRIFDKNKKLLATSNPYNTSNLLEKDSKILNSKYNKFKIYRHSIRDQKIGIREKIFTDDYKYYLEITVSQADVMKSILAAQKNSLIFFIICLLFFISGLIQVFYTLRNSFNKLEDSVIEIANGNLDKQIEIPKFGLLKELTISIKKMSKRLKIQIARLKQLEQYKSDFLQNITHEIKTPITAINSAIELLETKNSINNEDRECFDIIRYQTNAINILVNDILSLSEIEVEKTNEDKDFKWFNLKKTIKSTLDYMSISDIRFNFICDDEIKIYGNEDLISIMMSNLVSNAVKYAGTPKIDIVVNNTDDNIEIIVRDFGIGIAPEHINHIFERFYRIHKARSRQMGGTGLGLSIVKNIVELHNGTIEVQSEINKGTTFTIKFPKENQ